MTRTQTAPDIEADHGPLGEILSLGGSFFAVSVALDPDTGKCSKIPRISGWQKSADLPIKRKEQLDGAFAYGFHPETIGAYVIDLDMKEGKDGEDSLARAVLGDDPGLGWLRSPEVYVDTPNGRHVYLDRASIPSRLWRSCNNLLPGVDVRGDHAGGWLVAPGSVGWSLRREAWVRYELEGDLGHLPAAPQELIDLLEIHFKDQRPAAGESAPDFVIQSVGAPSLPVPEGDRKMASLFSLARMCIKSPEGFTALVQRFVPGARWDGHDFHTGDYIGGKGESCLWSPSNGIIKDFNDGGKGYDFLSWYVRFCEGPGNKADLVSAARAVVAALGYPDPTGGVALSETVAELKLSAPDGPPAAPAGGPEPRVREDEGVDAQPRQFPLTDSGNAERFIHLHGTDIRYIREQRDWISWRDGAWRRDGASAEAYRLTKSVARQIARDVIGSLSEASATQSRKAAKWALDSESEKHRNSMLKIAASEEGMGISEDTLDADPDLLGCPAGCVDLKTGEVRPSRREDLLCKSTLYTPEDGVPEFFMGFMQETFLGKDDVIEWMLAFLGYAITGRTSEQVFPIWWGHGKNGKSVLLSVMQGLLGPYARNTRPETFMAKVDSARYDIAALKGARFVYASETGDGHVLSPELVKEVTGGDPVTSRRPFGDFFTYTPSFKVVLVTNSKPRIQTQDYGTWRRLRLVPFEFTVPESRTIKDLDKVLLEREGGRIMGLLVRKAQAWLADKRLPPCEEITNVTREYKEREDPIGDFIATHCVVGSIYFCTLEQLHTEYLFFCHQRGVQHQMSYRSLSRLIEDRRDVTKALEKGKVVFIGIGVRTRENFNLGVGEREEG